MLLTLLPFASSTKVLVHSSERCVLDQPEGWQRSLCLVSSCTVSFGISGRPGFMFLITLLVVTFNILTALVNRSFAPVAAGLQAPFCLVFIIIPSYFLNVAS